MSWRARPLLLLPLLLPLGAAAGGHDGRQDPDMISSENMVDAMLVTLGELDKRLTVPVVVGGRGPYNFIIDTGAERTVVSRELAGSLRLTPGKPVTLTSMTGRSVVDTVVVPDLSIKSIGQLHTVTAPSLGARDLGAAGLLGIDTLSKHAVSIDFEKGTMAVRPSSKKDRDRTNGSNEIIVTAKSLFGQLIVTDAYYGHTRVQVVLDTGSQVTMGNMALRKRIGRARMKKAVQIELTSVTGGKMEADYTAVPDIRVGRLTFGEMPIAFADLAPFHRFGLTKRPALLLGMDALHAFQRVEIDFPNRQVRFVMKKVRERPGMFNPSQIGGYPAPSE
ncbi:retroviral-like aspartic protease family protein [Sphingomonas soli]|uniref:retroviral-like aspartic protease family protein n=1 Tax=Sphingomonas soli TaxID=266127 RepID=UPI0008333917|nr:retroviral-like aspartic protease family protein [Sphingomonas soli]